MTIHVISVGLSLYDALAKPDRKKLGDLADTIRATKPHQLLSTAEDSEAASTHLTAWLGTDGPDRAGLRTRVEPAKVAGWPVKISAEWETFARAVVARTVPSRDLAVLLATDTVECLTAALWNAAALVGGEIGKVRYLSTPEQLRQAPLVRGNVSVLVVRVPHLDASTEAGFQKAMRGLGVLGRTLLPSDGEPPEPFRFHLSGGFKAAIPYLIGLAEGLRSFPDAQVEALVLHESTEGAVIKLPLRRIRQDLVQQELRGFRPDGTGPKPDGLSLEGYAYDKVDEEYRLTSFGEGLRALMGGLSEPLAGG